jgi:hypothetical protein
LIDRGEAVFGREIDDQLAIPERQSALKGKAGNGAFSPRQGSAASVVDVESRQFVCPVNN